MSLIEKIFLLIGALAVLGVVSNRGSSRSNINPPPTYKRPPPPPNPPAKK
jgi:hypothetical protein